MLLNEKIELHRLLHKELIATHVVTTCINCEAFDKRNELCTLCNQRPPAETIVKGCEQWYDCIPF